MFQKVAIAAGLLLALCSFNSAQAQKFAYVDTRYILDKLPEYAAAEKEIDLISQKWQKELDGVYAQIEQLYQKYRAEEVLMTDAIKRERQDEILQKEKEARKGGGTKAQPEKGRTTGGDQLRTQPPPAHTVKPQRVA